MSQVISVLPQCLNTLSKTPRLHTQVIEIVKDTQGKSVVRVLPMGNFASSLEEEEGFEL